MVAALGLLFYEGVARRAPRRAVATPAATSPRTFPQVAPRLPVLQDVTLPPFVNSALEYNGQQSPLGTFASLTH
jgi:hypothetical protein